ncbi:hypothetical protein M413DRAFT_159877 [Hebeloma cylindrosporum]|uniref:F-box domain-containing protein n=1 Tax=Hebeloma cylindrosporum TaxID=76867 RepID=A0A0C2YJE7_HEBCY|nr:hypothetical protein M413DRAFT_159877 [Hebeloma cylindrosporum h7]
MANETTTRTTTIESLPAELLALVFDFCSELKHLDKIKHKKAQLNEPPWHFISKGLSPSQRFGSQVDRFKLLKSGVWFPYSHASVCRYWMEVLSSSPRYWRTAIFHLDSESKPPFDAASVLSWSKDLTVDIAIIKKDAPRSPGNMDDISEKQQVQALVDLLTPHLHRCRSIHIDVHLNSSLPRILRHFVGYPSILESLSLFCDFNDLSPRDEVLFPIRPEWGDTSLRSLVLDGRNLPDVCSGWLRSQRSLEQLVLLNYSVDAKNYIHLDHILETIQTLPNLLRLKFDKVFVLLGSSAVFTNQIQVLHFEEVEALIMDEIFRTCTMNELHTIHITRCSLPFVPAVSKLVLEDIDPRDPLEPILQEWEGSHLWIGRCRGFGDSFLDMLRTTSDWDDGEFHCPWVETLYLAHLPRFSLKKLKKMIKLRSRSINYDDPSWRTTAPFGPAIRELHVIRCDVAELTEKDMEWFRARVVTFRYLKQADPEL